jgi:Fe-S-cluster containining protein
MPTKSVRIRVHPWFNLVVNQNTAAIAKLCPACGICCNGVLFGDVELQRGDDAKLLTKLGVELFRKGRKVAFAQPCACLVKGLCAIYADRPKRCAAFDCGLLKRVQRDDLSANAALKKITEAKRRAAEVLDLVRQLGNTDESLPLNQRYSAVIAEPIDMSADEVEIERRGELMMAVSRLVDTLERDFLT